jgi:hypothetical protein
MVVLVGCNDPVTAVQATHQVLASARNVDTHSRANMLWQDSVDIGTVSAPNVVPAGIRGDGRNKFGQFAAPENEYQGNYCGVRAFIYDQRGEDGNLDPDTDTDYTSAMAPTCGSARQMAFYLGGSDVAPLVAGPHLLIDGLWKLGPGAVVVQPMDFGVQEASSCRFSFNASYAGASNVRLSRLADVQVVNRDNVTVTARQWRLQSQGTHRAACLVVQPNGKYLDGGTRYYLPFAVTITQVPYPFATYP